MMPFKQLLRSLLGENPTLYVSLQVPIDISAALYEYSDSVGIATPVPIGKHHITVCYSTTPVTYPYGRKRIPSIVVSPTTYHLRVMQGSTGRREVSRPALVLGLSHPKIQERFDAFKEMGASFSYDKFQPHVTLTYDWTGGDKYKTIPVPQFPIVLDVEQATEVKLNWSETLKK